MKSKPKQKRFSATMRVASFLGKKDFRSALEHINKYLYHSTLCNKNKAAYLVDLFSQPAITELLISHIVNKSEVESHIFCEHLLAFSFTNITIQKWRNAFLLFLEKLPEESLNPLSKIISKLYNTEHLITLEQFLPICYVLINSPNSQLFYHLSSDFEINSELADKFLEMISTNQAIRSTRRAQNIIILSNLMMNHKSLPIFCCSINQILITTQEHIDVLRSLGDVKNSTKYLEKTRRIIQYLPKNEQNVIFEYLRAIDKNANNALVASEILYAQDIIERNQTITDFKRLAYALDYADIDNNMQCDIARLLDVIYLMISKTSLPEQCNSWQKFTLCTFSTTSNFQSKEVWLLNAEKRPFITLDIFVTMYKKWETLIPSTSSLLLLMLDSIKSNHQEIVNLEDFIRKFKKLFQRSVRRHDDNRYIIAERLLNLSILPESALPCYFPFMSYNLHSVFSHGDLRGSFMVCKGGLTRALLGAYLPIELIINIFSKIGLFNHTTLHYEQSQALLLNLSEIDCILPNTQEFHIFLLKNINKSSPLTQRQKYLSATPHTLHSIISCSAFRQTFTVCKGGLTRAFLCSALPMDLIIKIFSEAQFFGQTAIQSNIENSIAIQTISQIDLIIPNTDEFHQAMLSYKQDAIEHHQSF